MTALDVSSASPGEVALSGVAFLIMGAIWSATGVIWIKRLGKGIKPPNGWTQWSWWKQHPRGMLAAGLVITTVGVGLEVLALVRVVVDPSWLLYR